MSVTPEPKFIRIPIAEMKCGDVAIYREGGRYSASIISTVDSHPDPDLISIYRISIAPDSPTPIDQTAESSDQNVRRDPT
jgi:hypothetical protein